MLSIIASVKKNTSCSKKFLETLGDRLEKNAVKMGSLRKGGGSFYRLTYSINSSLNLYRFMYNRGRIENKLFLPRKKVIFEEFIKNKYAAVAQR